MDKEVSYHGDQKLGNTEEWVKETEGINEWKSSGFEIL